MIPCVQAGGNLLAEYREMPDTDFHESFILKGVYYIQS